MSTLRFGSSGESVESNMHDLDEFTIYMAPIRMDFDARLRMHITRQIMVQLGRPAYRWKRLSITNNKKDFLKNFPAVQHPLGIYLSPRQPDLTQRGGVGQHLLRYYR